MAISAYTQNVLKVALANPAASNELLGHLNESSGSPSTPVAPVAVTFTAGGTPTEYTTPAGSLTVGNSTTPTVVELLNYCNELRGNIAGINAILLAQGLT